MMRLLLQDWDEQRGIVRASRYASFDVDEKLDFLSAVAYELTLVNQYRFGFSDLEHIYTHIAPRFELPLNEAERVVRELESHTGVIARTGQGLEFVHLSLQEYLAAYYMVRQPFSSKTLQYLYDYPEVVAIAIAISSEPSRWFAELLLHPAVSFSRIEFSRLAVRIVQERPAFDCNTELGYAMLLLLFSQSLSAGTVLADIASTPGVAESIRSIYTEYVIQEGLDFVGMIRKDRAKRTSTGLLVPSSGSIPSAVFVRLFGEFGPGSIRT